MPARAPSQPDFETPPISSAFGDDDRSADRGERPNALSNPNLRRVVPSAPPPTVIPLDVDASSIEGLSALPSLDRNTEPSGLLAQGTPALRKRPNPAAATAAAAAATATATAAAAASNAARPASRFAAAPPKTASSIFGDGVISEQSLDEVILSYLAEDLDGSSE